jgi:phosphate transport system substrate-binding protein
MASSHDADTAGITRRKSLSALAGAGALALAGCTQSGNGGDGGDELSGPINIAGSSTVFPLMSAVMEDFAAEHPGVDPDISSTGSGGGFSNFFCTGDTDFNNASRPIQPEEEEL